MPATNLLQSALDSQRAGRLAEAAVAYQQLLREQPQHATAHHNLALLLLQQNRLDAALAHMREAARLQPNSLEIQNNLGGLWEHAGRWNEAIQAYQQAAVLAPESPVPYCNLGEALCKVGRNAEALVALRAAATLDPELPEAWRALGSALLDAKQPQAAVAAFQRTVKLRPEDDGAWYGLGRALMECGRIVQAVRTFQQCLTIQPQYASALHDLGKCLFDLGCLEQALPRLRQAADAGSNAVRQHAWENIAVIVPGSPADDNRSILEARQTWGRQWPSRPAPPPRQLAHGQPLRIGYVSSFFHRANWMKPVRALLQRHDRKRLEIHLFCDGPAEELRSEYRLQDQDHIHPIRGQSNETLAEKIKAEHIDILVDLNGYSAPPRMALYPLRPAPVQVGWFNYYATSGLDCFDYLIGDQHVIPRDEEAFYTERILRVPTSYLAFDVDYPVPEVAASPLLAGQPLTFGCLASAYKLTDAVIDVWSQILHGCPAARLLIRNKRLDRHEHQEFLRNRFAVRRIAPDRLLLDGPADHFEFLDTYRRIDVALDPFPYSGGTTTMEALWQGVPVVTSEGDRWAARTSVSLLRSAGLEEYVGRDRADYVQLCTQLAKAPDLPQRLAVLRAGLRDRLRRSPVCNTAAFAKDIESLYLQIWRTAT